jgi:hypothetical protein
LARRGHAVGIDHPPPEEDAAMSSVSHQTVRLERGKHSSPASGACVMELASMLAGERFSDQPRCVCPVVAALLRRVNDALDDERRQTLYRFASAAVGSRATEGVRRRRLERCRREMQAARARRPPIARLVGGPSAKVADHPSTLELDRFMASLVRTLVASGRGWDERAVALADDLLAIRVKQPMRSAPARRTVPVAQG